MSNLLPSIESCIDELAINKNTQADERKAKKRKEYIEWEEYFMLTAKVTSLRSKDPNCQVGCVIVDENKHIVGTGYNGFPVGCSDDDFPWGKGNENPLDNKYAYVVHAEANAILNKIKGDLKGATIYTTLFPCNECAKLIIQSGIKHVVYLEDRNKPIFLASKRMFDAVNLEYRQYVFMKEKLSVTLSKSDFQ
ncbi:unnamed protein product [Auanema sp. JU1783]|nr:unnamed protein product [Auanema sp. JU1783]